VRLKVFPANADKNINPWRRNRWPISWGQSLSVGVSQFDDQHKKLIDLINRLHEAMKTGNSKDALGDFLQSLAD
jgi:hypothetical protein